MRRLALLSLTLLVALIGACAAPNQDEKLSQYCQLQKCDCVPEGLFLFESKPVVWQKDGSASCEEGFRLHKL
jgi:hypothetical protein